MRLLQLAYWIYDLHWKGFGVDWNLGRLSMALSAICSLVMTYVVNFPPGLDSLPGVFGTGNESDLFIMRLVFAGVLGIGWLIVPITLALVTSAAAVFIWPDPTRSSHWRLSSLGKFGWIIFASWFLAAMLHADVMPVSLFYAQVSAQIGDWGCSPGDALCGPLYLAQENYLWALTSLMSLVQAAGLLVVVALLFGAIGILRRMFVKMPPDMAQSN